MRSMFMCMCQRGCEVQVCFLFYLLVSKKCRLPSLQYTLNCLPSPLSMRFMCGCVGVFFWLTDWLTRCSALFKDFKWADNQWIPGRRKRAHARCGHSKILFVSGSLVGKQLWAVLSCVCWLFVFFSCTTRGQGPLLVPSIHFPSDEWLVNGGQVVNGQVMKTEHFCPVFLLVFLLSLLPLPNLFLFIHKGTLYFPSFLPFLLFSFFSVLGTSPRTLHRVPSHLLVYPSSFPPRS